VAREQVARAKPNQVRLPIAPTSFLNRGLEAGPETESGGKRRYIEVEMSESAAPKEASGRTPRVLVVDDEKSIVDFIRLGLQYEGFQVQTAPDGQVALRLISEFKPHVVVLDVMMPKLDGLAVAEAVKGNKDTGIIILSARDEVADKIKGLEVGADDYLVKPFDFGELLARIRAVMRRRNPSLGPQLQVQDVSLDETTREVRRGGKQVELSSREFDLLRLLMMHPNQVLPRERILDQVWGYNFFGDANNVEVYVRYLRQKLDDEDHHLIQTVRGVGYRIKS
jgi:DNA-binding response OmpR family regulator